MVFLYSTILFLKVRELWRFIQNGRNVCLILIADDGIDCRVHYIKVVSLKQKQNGLSRDLFDKDLVR